MSDYRSDSGGEEDDIPVDQQVTWTYKRPAMIDVNHRINSSSRDGIINDISEVLQEIDTETYQKFEKSVFGRLLKLPKNISRSNVCMHYVISREVVISPDSDPTVKWYMINEQNLRFSRYEFALVTGLRFGACNFNPYEDHTIPEDSVYTRIFGNEPITPDKLRSMFIDKEHIEGATNDDYLKISKVLFVYCVLVAKDCTRHCIPDWLWCLVEDDRDWESFPWGSFSYQILFTYLSNIRTCLASAQVQQYHLYGFVTTFLAWIFCAIEDFGDQCKKLSFRNKIPRMLRYSFDNTSIDTRKIEGTTHVTLEPTATEMERRFWKSIEQAGTAFLLKYNHTYDGQQLRALKKQGANALRPPVQHGRRSGNNGEEELEERYNERLRMPFEEPRRSPLTSPHHNAGTTTHHETGTASHATMAPNQVFLLTWDQRQIFIQEIGNYTAQRVQQEFESQREAWEKKMREMVTEEYEEQRPKIVQEVGDYVLSNLGDVFPGYSEYMEYHSQRTEQDAAEWNMTMSQTMPENEMASQDNPKWTQREPSTETNWRMSQEGNLQWPNQTPNLRANRHRKPSAALKSPLLPNDRRGDDYLRFMRLKNPPKRNVGIGYAVGKPFFTSIKNFKSDLEEEHINAYLLILTSKPEVAQIYSFDSTIAITDTTFMELLLEIWKENHANDPPDTTYDPDVEEKLTEDSLEQLAMYANGEVPDWGGSLGKWYEYEKVVFAFHQPSKHWGTILIHLAEGSVILYDSFEHVFDQECYDEWKKLLIPLVRIFPQILKYTGIYEHRTDLKPFFTQWKFKYPGKENPYNQKDDHSCGPIALKYVEFLMTNEKDPPLLQKDIEKYRAHIARTIYEFSTHEDTIS